jgi:BirA family biotin operon repressor/biotin-[acetyl-CoA-carboxylase] ligase
MPSTKTRILMMLFERPHQFISGQEMSDVIGCSRTAVWKQIKELEKDGYMIESVPKKGYRLKETPNRLSPEEILAGLNTEKFGRQIVYEPSMPSTQKRAHHLAEDGAPEGTLVISDEQTEGRGRLGRTWHSPKGTGIWMSLILRPKLSLNRIPQLTLMTAVAIVKAIKVVTGIECQIKWPNDIFYNGKKLVGILTELQAEENQAKAVIIGMGMNVNLTAEDLPDDIIKIATSIQMITGKPCSRAHLIQVILAQMESFYHLYIEAGFSLIKTLWETYAMNMDRIITARNVNGQVVKGFARGINDEGVLLLEDQEGHIHRIYSTDIEFNG